MTGPARDTATDDRILAIAARLESLDIDPTNARIALVLTWERGKRITREAVRARRNRMNQ